MSNFKKIKEKFNQLSLAEKDKLIKDIYDFSKDMEIFLENRFLGNKEQDFVFRMKKETIGKVYRKGTPGTPNGKAVNSIIIKAKKSFADCETIMKLEQLAYRGFIEYLNEYGGGPETFEYMACNHLENFLNLVRENVSDKDNRAKIFEEVRIYLKKKKNMLVDSLYDVFEGITGIPMSDA